ncbi:MAG: cupin domain-containing protein [Ferruginibacter sp.]
MITEDIIASGILENYVMGFTTAKENAEVELYAAAYPAVDEELQKIRNVFETYLLANKMKPSPRAKSNLMKALYKQEAGAECLYPPLIEKELATQDLLKWLTLNPFKNPTEGFDNLHTQDLPSTPYISNFLVWAKEGHQDEMHTDMDEFLFIIKGSCTMYFDEKPSSYQQGELIHIPPYLSHRAVVTSREPMMALVQRQMLV